MRKSVTVFSLVYFLIIGVILCILNFFPCTVYYSVANTLLTCIIARYAFPWVKTIVFNQRVSPRNKAVLITGCDTGFGHLLAKKLDSKGFQVFASCLFPDGNAAKTLKETCSDSLHVFGLDVTKDADVKAAVDYVKKNLKGFELWAVVNNAGILKGFEIEWTKMEDFQEVMDINAMGVVRVTKAFLPLLRSSKGRLITITSVAGRLSVPSFSAYGMSKFATTGFCECLRQEMHPWGVKVIVIEPEGFRTPLANCNSFELRMDDAVRHLDEDIKEDYGLHYYEEYKEAMQRHLKRTSSRVYKVIDSLEEAVILEEPCDVYRPRRNIAFRLLFALIESFPKPITDLLIYAAQHLSGFPQPKEAEYRF